MIIFQSNKQNIVTLKLFMVLAMVIGHCVIYGAIYWPSGDFFGRSLPSFQLRSFAIAIVGCLPALAGYVHFHQYPKQTKNGIKSTFQIFGFLFFVEGIKSIYLTKRLISFFHFDVLILIGLSLLLIELLRRWNSYLSIVVAFLLLILNPFFDYLRWNFVFNDTAFYYQHLPIISWSFFSLFTFLFMSFLFKKYFKSSLKKLLFYSLMAIAINYKMFFLEIINPRLLFEFFNYPLGSLVGVYGGLHVWPFLVWFPMIVFGFNLSRIHLWLHDKKWGHFIIGFLCLYYMYFYNTEIFAQNFLQKMNGAGLGNESVYFVNTLRLLYHCSILPILIYFIQVVEALFKISRFQFAGVSSRWILCFYLVSIFIPDFLAPKLAPLMGHSFGFFTLFILSTLICFLVAYFLDIVFLRIRINLKFEKVK